MVMWLKLSIIIVLVLLANCAPPASRAAPPANGDSRPKPNGQSKPSINPLPLGEPKPKPAKPDVELPKEHLTSSNYGQFFCDTKIKEGHYPTIRYRKNETVISRHDFINLLISTTKEGFDFRFLFNQCIANLAIPKESNNGYMLQAPIIEPSIKDEPFYLVAIASNVLGSNIGIFKNYLVHCDPPAHSAVKNQNYEERFWKLFAVNSDLLGFSEIIKEPTDAQPIQRLSFGAVVFKGGYSAPNPQEMMVSPCPISSGLRDKANDAVAHIYSFATSVNNHNEDSLRRLHSFWYAVGAVANKMFDGKKVTDFDGNLLLGKDKDQVPHAALFLNTHGHIPYLHFRVENTHEHYGQVPDLLMPKDSQNYYSRLFE